MPCERFDWQTLAREQLNPGLARQFITGARTTVARFQFQKGCAVPVHSHENEQVTYVLEGALRFQLQDQKNGGGARELDIRSGQLLLIPPNVAHGAVALEDTVALDFFSPVRQDWLSGTDTYLRG